ncbi:MAG TPA: pitrilysin family protein [Phycisphaerae bacterium]|nr:pitrilysin family protein [Phycisphaerae bacterium]
MATFHHAQLPNGLDVIAEVNPDAQSTAIGFMVRTGARDEAPQVAGVSHFLEHMLFKGTARRSAAEVNREFDEMGARNNAFTSNEVTCYWAHILPEFLPRTLDLLADMMRPALRESDFDMEKKVILEEIALYLDRPGHVLYEAVMADHFRTHPLAHSVLGSRESIGALQRNQMKQYFDSHYGPGNMVLSVAGKLDFDQLTRLATQACGKWEHLNVKRSFPQANPGGAQHHISDPKLKRHYIALMCPGPSAQDNRRYAAQVLADTVGDHDGSRLYWALVEPGLADEADFSFYPHDGTGSYFAYASCDPERKDQVQEILQRELEKMASEGPTRAEIDKSRNKIATATVLSGELPLGRMRSICGRWIYLGDYQTLEQDLAELQAVDVGHAQELLTEFPFKPATITTLGPS